MADEESTLSLSHALSTDKHSEKPFTNRDCDTGKWSMFVQASLDRCSKCGEPISDRLLRAVGGAFHVTCQTFSLFSTNRRPISNPQRARYSWKTTLELWKGLMYSVFRLHLCRVQRCSRWNSLHDRSGQSSSLCPMLPRVSQSVFPFFFFSLTSFYPFSS